MHILLSTILGVGIMLGGGPDKPNWVCSCVEQNDSHYVAPLKVEGRDSVIRRLSSIVQSLPRTTITEEDAGQLRAECRSRFFGFVDDLHCVYDEEANVVHIRSASRSGYYDFGVNRKRVETIRGLWAP
ncbi:MAG: DUF1499 domain-containing protein [Chlamydiia bacterium]|nr:DUF1499 domain-containing protein [Chlamydiia bacterium]